MITDDRGYLGNSNLKRHDAKIEWTPDLLKEYKKCSEDPIYFAEKYIQIVSVDDGLIPITLYDYQKEIIEKITDTRRVAVLTSRQAGKALHVDTPIPLYDGSWKTMGTVEPGDIIIGSDGKPTKVLFKSNIHHKPTYKLTIEGNRDDVYACEDHLWFVFDRQCRKYVTVSTKRIAEQYKRTNARNYTEYRYAIPNVQPIQYPERELPIDPYTLGIWLGDGTSASSGFTCDVKHLPFFKQQGIEFSSDLSYGRNQNDTVFTNSIVGIHKKLRLSGLLNDKHIPEIYKNSSVEQRTALLQGLMDTDGFVEKNGTCQIQLTNKNLRLLTDIHDLLSSLGLKVTVTDMPGTNSVRFSFSTSLEHIVPVRIPHKLERIKQSLERDRYVFSKSIRGVELVETQPTQCITVDNSQHCFVYGRDFTVTHNTTVAVAVILHYILFNKHKTVALLANKGDAAREILDRIQIAYEALPKWIQSGVVEWNKGSIELKNGCKVIAAATSSSAIRGKSVSFLYIDEAAFVENWDEFFSSVFPTISSGKKTKLLFTSTPNGLNHYHSICTGAQKGKNGYEYVEVKWDRVPGRDEAWRQDTLSSMNFNMEKFNQEFCCEFLGSSGTLISGAALSLMEATLPLYSHDSLKVYEDRQGNNQYMIICDVSRGKGLDYSAFHVIDITSMPYKQVATYRSNLVTPLDYASIIYRTAKGYNSAAVLVEINDTGGQVADSLFHDFEYDNILYTENAGARGKRIATGFGKGGVDRGIRTTKTVKAIGCSMLKLLIEQRQLLINDHQTIFELSRFSKKGSSYEAESGCNDDLVMGLVLFGWASDQQYFKEITDVNTLERLRDLTEDEIQASLTPFGFIDDGLGEEEVIDLTQTFRPDFQFF